MSTLDGAGSGARALPPPGQDRSERIPVAVVPHTHWDREWYMPFQRFRLRLVDVVDNVLGLLEQHDNYRFTLDGQLATVDDYLQIRPRMEQRVRTLASEGRLALGPWQILMDEFLVSGETIIRNLEAGLARAAELGGTLAVGYLPDMFGHVAQMPQLLHRAGIRDAVVWRGVPASIEDHRFRWQAPDGSTVNTEYLVDGYSNAAYIADEPERIGPALERLAATLEPFFGDDERLAMAGTDHMSPSRELPALIERVNREQQRFHLRLATLSEYLERAPAGDALAVWDGELRSGARANMLMGVNSARLDLKRAFARTERLLTRGAEPLLALEDVECSETFLQEAWARVIASSAHDSICGCSADEVCDQVLVRLAEAEQIAAGLVERALNSAAARVPSGAVVVHNPSPHPRVAVVEIDVPVPDELEEISFELPDGRRLATQEVERFSGLLYDADVASARLPSLLSRIHGRELFGWQVNRFEVDVDRRSVLFEVDQTALLPFDVTALERELLAAAASMSKETFRVRIVTAPRRRLLATVPAPPLGWTSIRVAAGTGELEHPVRARPRSLDNGLVRVVVAGDGTLEISGGGVALSGAGRLVDGGDAGDSYNYAPPARDTLVETPLAVSVELASAGPVVGRLLVRRTFCWPLRLGDERASRSVETAAVNIETAVELHAGERFLRVRVSFDNRCSDHRLRVHVPLAVHTESSFSEGQFAVVERRGVPEGGHGEIPLATHPAHGFVDAGGVALLLDHPSEYELVDGRELALTLLRSIGLISRSDNPYREEPAGPELAIPAAQCQGPWSASFGLYPHAGTWSEADVLAALEAYLHPFRTAIGTGPQGSTPEPQPRFELKGRGVVLSSLRRRGATLELRIACEQGEPRTAIIAGELTAAREADLRGRPGESLPIAPDGLRLELEAWQIRTVLLEH